MELISLSSQNKVDFLVCEASHVAYQLLGNLLTDNTDVLEEVFLNINDLIEENCEDVLKLIDCNFLSIIQRNILSDSEIIQKGCLLIIFKILYHKTMLIDNTICYNIKKLLEKDDLCFDSLYNAIGIMILYLHDYDDEEIVDFAIILNMYNVIFNFDEPQRTKLIERYLNLIYNIYRCSLVTDNVELHNIFALILKNIIEYCDVFNLDRDNQKIIEFLVFIFDQIYQDNVEIARELYGRYYQQFFNAFSCYQNRTIWISQCLYTYTRYIDSKPKNIDGYLDLIETTDSIDNFKCLLDIISIFMTNNDDPGILSTIRDRINVFLVNFDQFKTMKKYYFCLFLCNFFDSEKALDEYNKYILDLHIHNAPFLIRTSLDSGKKSTEFCCFIRFIFFVIKTLVQKNELHVLRRYIDHSELLALIEQSEEPSGMSYCDFLYGIKW